MLKIKDNVDLKELEKFGFVKLDNDCRGHKYSWRRIIDMNGYYELYINKDNKLSVYIEIGGYDYVRIAGKLQTKLYDLIKADLVEKVGD